MDFPPEPLKSVSRSYLIHAITDGNPLTTSHLGEQPLRWEGTWVRKCQTYCGCFGNPAPVSRWFIPYFIPWNLQCWTMFPIVTNWCRISSIHRIPGGFLGSQRMLWFSFGVSQFWRVRISEDVRRIFWIYETLWESIQFDEAANSFL